MFTDDELLPISALQHLLFCPRQCALIHLEQQWAENRLTVEGKHLHDKADHGRSESRPGIRIARGLQLRCFRLGLVGKADVVEFREAGRAATPRADPLTPAVPFPVEYKRGKPKEHDADRVQLCAQALCLEEMLNVPVPAGALFYGETRRRLDVPFDPSLRDITEALCRELRAMIDSGTTPPAVREKKCDNCSLLYLCMPGSLARPASAYLAAALTRSARHVPTGPEDAP